MNPFLIRHSFIALLFLFSGFASASQSASESASATSFTVEVSGKGKPIIFIPGLASSGEVWKTTVAQFSNRYECHVITLAGFAGVAPITAPLLTTVQKELVEYIDAKRMDRPIIVGHSLGGFLALRIAADTPTKVGRLVIVDSLPALGAVQMPDITPEQLKSMAARMRDAMKSQDAVTFAEGQRRSIASMVTKPEDVERVLGWGRKSDGATVVNAMHDLIATDLRADIARIKSPTLVLGTWIAYKDYTTRAAVEDTFKTQYRKLDGVTIEVADTARHFIMYDDPKWLLERMEKFLK
jgi:pimeloyl-ACP methyl ester carboxylesterase